MRRLMVAIAAIGATLVGIAVYWRRNRRVGTRFMNEVLDPFLVGRGISGAGRSELGTLEHVGRRSGIRRLTPIHPVLTDDGVRIVVPLGPKSEWARNVLAAGHCRMQLHDTVYELDEPALLPPRVIDDLSTPERWVCERLGFMYLRLHRFAERPGALEPIATEAAGVAGPIAAEQPTEEPTEEPIVEPSPGAVA